MVWGMATLVVAQCAGDKKTPIPGPMLNQGTVNYDTPDLTLSLVRSSQTVAALKPERADGFDFTPGDLLTKRSQDGYFHLGDITLRLRTTGTLDEWNMAIMCCAPAPKLLCSACTRSSLPSYAWRS